MVIDHLLTQLLLVGGFEPPLWKMMEWKSVGMMKFPTEWKNNPNVPNHQPGLVYIREDLNRKPCSRKLWGGGPVFFSLKPNWMQGYDWSLPAIIWTNTPRNHGGCRGIYTCLIWDENKSTINKGTIKYLIVKLCSTDYGGFNSSTDGGNMD